MTAGTSLGTVSDSSSDSDLVQLLTPEGERAEHPNYAASPEPEELRRLYRDLVLIRRTDAEATALQRKGELGLWTPLLGQEAAQVGSARALEPDDMVFPSYREHGVAWCRGMSPEEILRLFRGLTHGGWDPAARNLHLYSIVVGSQPLHATGYAMGLQRDGAEAAVLTYFGDGAISEGDVNEAFTWASVFHTPVVFFCQNNQWAVSQPPERQSRIPLYRRAHGFGFPGVRVDGNDVLAVLAVTRAALQAAREDQGPTLIEALTYRIGAHTTSDDPSRYRVASELEAWKHKDPVERVKAYLLRQRYADPAFVEEVDAEADRLCSRLREACVAMPDPPPLSLFEHVHAEEHPIVAEERDQYAAYLESLAEEPGPASGEPAGKPGAGPARPFGTGSGGRGPG